MSSSSRISCCFGNTHAYATALTSSEYLSTLIVLHGLGNIDKDIAAVLHQVLFLFTEEALSGTINLIHGIQRIVGSNRTEVNEGIVQEWFVIACLGMAVLIEILSEVCILIVIDTVGATENLLYVALYIFYIG